MAAEPESLLLKVRKSVAKSWPLLVMLALGRLMTKELVLVVMLKILPAVPVETLEITPAPREMEVEVPIKTFWPPVTVKPVPTVREPRVVVPMPPLVTGITPVIAMVEVPEIAMLVEPVKRVAMSEKAGAAEPLLLRTWKDVPALVERNVLPS